MCEGSPVINCEAYMSFISSMKIYTFFKNKYENPADL